MLLRLLARWAREATERPWETTKERSLLPNYCLLKLSPKKAVRAALLGLILFLGFWFLAMKYSYGIDQFQQGQPAPLK